MKNKTKKFVWVLLATVMGFYALNLAIFTLEYIAAQKKLTHYYHSLHPTYACQGGAVLASDYAPMRISPINYLLPAAGVKYFVEAGPEGYLSPFGDVEQTGTSPLCLLQ